MDDSLFSSLVLWNDESPMNVSRDEFRLIAERSILPSSSISSPLAEATTLPVVSGASSLVGSVSKF